MKRECGTCTKCCDGWLTADIYGHKMEPGKPCPFVGEHKCTIYNNKRPQICSDFKCGWLKDDGTLFDEWMRPNNINVIFVHYKIEDVVWYKLAEAGEKVNTLLLSYIIQIFTKNNVNLEYWINGAQFLIGTQKFKDLVKTHHD